MKEMARILRQWSAAQEAGEELVLATVVKTRGSSYRLPGARLLLGQNGQRAGSVSGGCLEDDVIKKAWWLTENGPVIRRYDTMPDGEISTDGYGLGCNGIIHIMLERIQPDTPSVLDLIHDVRANRRAAQVAHVLAPAAEIGRRLPVIPGAPIDHTGRDLFVETLAPAVRLLIFGAGDDAVPLADLAGYLGWHVSVFDSRPHYARPEKFPRADEVIVRSAETRLPRIDDWTVAVLMSHSYRQDLEMLRHFAAQPLRYLGILGPAKRAAQLLADAEIVPSALTSNLHSPMGLDIGADGPEQVALAVIAEIQAVLNSRPGGALRTRAGSIHAKESEAADAQNPFVRSIVCA